MRVLFYLEHTIQDASLDAVGRPRVVSRQLQFIELDEKTHANPQATHHFWTIVRFLK